jgi:hypothetical protein
MADGADDWDDDDPEDIGTVRWFGFPWGAPMNRTAAQVPTPVGRLCVLQDGAIKVDDQGVVIPYVGEGPDGNDTAVYHLECFLGHLGLDDYKVEAPQ